MSQIVITGAKENNLKNIDIVVPRNKIVCFVGVSGSGKSTIAFDIIAREGQRQYFESLSSYARRFLQKSNRPNVETISGISSTVIISQDRVHGNPRSTVGTLTEAYTYLRMLYSRVGFPVYDSSYFSFNHPYGACPKCKGLGRSVEVDVEKLIDREKSLNEGALIPSEWYPGGRQWSIIRASHYFDMDKKLKDFDEYELEKLLYSKPEMLESDGQYIVDRWTFQGIVYRIMHRNTKIHRGPSESDMHYFEFVDCPLCKGWRIGEKGLGVVLNGKNIGEVANMPLTQCLAFVTQIEHPHAAVIKPRLIAELQHLINVGVGYLSLNRSSDTLSGGEAQRVKMARQLGSDLIETIYVLDEPTAGLHPRDVAAVVENLIKLRDAGNSVLVVEHDEEVVKNADYIIEIGPEGGSRGGTIVSQGAYQEKRNENIMTNFKKVVRKPQGWLTIEKASRHNLKNVTLPIPQQVLIALTGVSGSGKSSLVEELMSQHGDSIVCIDQRAIGANKRGSIVTYVGAFDRIRKIFANNTGMAESLFSFNGKGACTLCKGIGYIDMDMNFLGNVQIHCESCEGSRYKEKVLRYTYKGKTIVDVLAMTAREVRDFFDDSQINESMNMLIAVGLDYITMGQTLNTLSGGESQRLKLASRLNNKGEFYVLDEPTTGLHLRDVEKLMTLLNRLVNGGNTVLIVEHNTNVIRTCDWVIDLGPEGGEDGGYVIASCPPHELSKNPQSITGRYL